MPRPWTLDDDTNLRNMYTRADTPMQLIRNTLHRNTHDIHGRADQLRSCGFNREVRRTVPPVIKTDPEPQIEIQDASYRLLAQAANALRRNGFAPVYAQRYSDQSTRETGLLVVEAESSCGQTN